MYGVNVRVIHVLITQRPNDPRTSISGQLTFMNRFLCVNFNERLRKDNDLCVVYFNERRSHGPKRVEGCLHGFVRTRSTRFCICVLRKGNVVLIKLRARARAVITIRVGVNVSTRVLVRVGPIAVIHGIRFARDSGQLNEGGIRRRAVATAISFNRQANVGAR